MEKRSLTESEPAAGRVERHTVRFRLAKGAPLPVVQAWVDDEGPFAFVLDTGASMTVVSPRVAKRLGGQGRRFSTGGGAAVAATGQVPVAIGTVASLRVDSFHVNDLAVAVMSLRRVRKAAKTRIDGIVGFNAFRDCRLTIDYPKGRLVFERDGDGPSCHQASTS
ncbi:MULTISPECIES: retropepsin-like aspartic protease [Streptomyces]|uniref:retropepsin-like aspartic protease n=1 Tax=Streptomyces TaxID=1883 RepID=UPI00133167E6|nr:MULTISPECIES: retropepsin-like aspartic protease [Streptomyces]